MGGRGEACENFGGGQNLARCLVYSKVLKTGKDVEGLTYDGTLTARWLRRLASASCRLPQGLAIARDGRGRQPDPPGTAVAFAFAINGTHYFRLLSSLRGLCTV